MVLHMRLKNRPIYSIRTKLAGIIFLCWIIPIISIVGFIGFYVSRNIHAQLVKETKNAASSSVETFKANLDSAVEASRDASYNQTVLLAWESYLQNRDSIALKDKVDRFLFQNYKYENKFSTTIIYYKEDPDTIYYTYNGSMSGNYKALQFYRDTVHQEIQKISSSGSSGIMFYTLEQHVYMIRNMLDDEFLPVAVLVTELNMPVISKPLHNIPWEIGFNLRINNSELYKEQTSAESDLFSSLDFSKTYNQIFYFEKKDEAYIYGIREIEAGRLSYIVKIDYFSVMNELSKIYKTLIGLIAFVLPLLFISLYFIKTNVNKPVRSLALLAEKIEHGNFGVRTDEQFNNREFSELADSINIMSSTLKEQFEKLFLEELALRDAQIANLQSQINPHFLNNTLEIINWEARLNDNIKISKMVEALSNILDSAMDRGHRTIIPLSEELRHVDSYFYIISQRLGKRLSLNMEIDNSLLDFKIPKLIMQPLAENAVEHGIMPHQRGSITIRAYHDDAFLFLEIENDGQISDDDKQRINQLLLAGNNAENDGKGHIGIYNVNKRLKLIFGETSGLSIASTNSGSCLARIVIPFDHFSA
jgi:two-component system sensor histidine kinase YesM